MLRGGIEHGIHNRSKKRKRKMPEAGFEPIDRLVDLQGGGGTCTLCTTPPKSAPEDGCYEYGQDIFYNQLQVPSLFKGASIQVHVGSHT